MSKETLILHTFLILLLLMALATTVGVLTEVPVMLSLAKVANSTEGWFKNG